MREAKAGTGVTCPKCGGLAKAIKDSRGGAAPDEAQFTVRFRRCSGCGENVKTFEVAAQDYHAMISEMQRMQALFDGLMNAAGAYR